MKPSIARNVIIRNYQANGHGDQAAVITGIFGDADPADTHVVVNLMAFPDAHTPLPLTSVRLFDCQEDAEDSIDFKAGHRVCHWPRRI